MPISIGFERLAPWVLGAVGRSGAERKQHIRALRVRTRPPLEGNPMLLTKHGICHFSFIAAESHPQISERRECRLGFVVLRMTRLKDRKKRLHHILRNNTMIRSSFLIYHASALPVLLMLERLPIVTAEVARKEVIVALIQVPKMPLVFNDPHMMTVHFATQLITTIGFHNRNTRARNTRDRNARERQNHN